MTEVRLRTYWSDCDPAGIVYFANFFRFIEQAEEELYLMAGANRQALCDEYRVWMPRVEAHVDFVSPIRAGRTIRVRMSPEFVGQRTTKFNFEIVDDETSNRLADGYMTVVCVDREKFKATPIPERIREILSGL